MPETLRLQQGRQPNKEMKIGELRNIYFKNTKNLFIHVARIPIGDSPRVHPNILKMSPPFASSKGVSASGVRYQSDGV